MYHVQATHRQAAIARIICFILVTNIWVSELSDLLKSVFSVMRSNETVIFGDSPIWVLDILPFDCQIA